MLESFKAESLMCRSYLWLARKQHSHSGILRLTPPWHISSHLSISKRANTAFPQKRIYLTSAHNNLWHGARLILDAKQENMNKTQRIIQRKQDGVAERQVGNRSRADNTAEGFQRKPFGSTRVVGEVRAALRSLAGSHV